MNLIRKRRHELSKQISVVTLHNKKKKEEGKERKEKTRGKKGKEERKGRKRRGKEKRGRGGGKRGRRGSNMVRRGERPMDFNQLSGAQHLLAILSSRGRSKRREKRA